MPFGRIRSVLQVSKYAAYDVEGGYEAPEGILLAGSHTSPKFSAQREANKTTGNIPQQWETESESNNIDDCDFLFVEE